VDEGKLEVSGKGRATGYSLAGSALVRAHLQTPYNRRRPASYKKEFLDRYIPNKTFYLPEADRQRLREAGTPTAAPLPAGTYVRRSVLEWKAFRPELLMAMAAEAEIPEADREEVVRYIGNEFRGLHEGNVIRYRLRPEDLAGISREGPRGILSRIFRMNPSLGLAGMRC
jgi:hypothetical protein